MRFTVPSKTLYSHVSAVSKVINSKNALSILDNFLFTLEEGRLTIMGSDVENAIWAKFEVTESEGEGNFCLNARTLVELLKEFPDQPTTVEINDENLEVKISYSGGNYSMVAISGDQFPQYKKESSEEEPVKFVYPSAQLAKGIENTVFAVGADDFHPQMMGILFDIVPESITFVATDTRKMVKYVNYGTRPEVTAKCIMPSKPANVLKSILPKEEDAMVEVEMTTKSASFTAGNYTFNCRFIKGNYPDYTRVIPKNNPYQLRVNRTEFLNSVRRVGIIVDPGYGMEKFKINENNVYIKSSDTTVMRAGNEKIACEYNGPEIVIGFSAPYLIEICNVITSDDLLVNLADPSRPGVFCPTENPEGTDLLVLLMPMNVNEF